MEVNARRLANSLHACYGYLKALQSLFAEVVQIHEATKQHIREFEANLNSLLDSSHWSAKPYHSLDELEAGFKSRCIQGVENEEEKIAKIRTTLYEDFIKFHTGIGMSLLSSISDPYRRVFSQQGLRTEGTESIATYKLKNEYIAYTKKFAGVIEVMYKILKRDEAVEDYIRKELEITYRLLSEGDTSLIYPVDKSVSETTARLIEELERAYDAM